MTTVVLRYDLLSTTGCGREAITICSASADIRTSDLEDITSLYARCALDRSVPRAGSAFTIDCSGTCAPRLHLVVCDNRLVYSYACAPLPAGASGTSCGWTVP